MKETGGSKLAVVKIEVKKDLFGLGFEKLKT